MQAPARERLRRLRQRPPQLLRSASVAANRIVANARQSFAAPSALARTQDAQQGAAQAADAPPLLLAQHADSHSMPSSQHGSSDTGTLCSVCEACGAALDGTLQRDAVPPIVSHRISRSESIGTLFDLVGGQQLSEPTRRQLRHVWMILNALWHALTLLSVLGAVYWLAWEIPVA